MIRSARKGIRRFLKDNGYSAIVRDRDKFNGSYRIVMYGNKNDCLEAIRKVCAEFKISIEKIYFSIIDK